MAQGTDNSMSAVICVAVYIQEFFNEYFVIVFTSNKGGVGPWQRCVLSESSSCLLRYYEFYLLTCDAFFS